MIACNRSWRFRGVVIASALLSAGALVITPKIADAGGGISPGAAAGIGLGAFALGTLAARPYYGPYGYYPGAYYYPPPPAYYSYAPRSCWDPYYQRYYAC